MLSWAEECWIKPWNECAITVLGHNLVPDLCLYFLGVVQRTTLEEMPGSIHEGIFCRDHLRVQLFRLNRRGRTHAQGGDHDNKSVSKPTCSRVHAGVPDQLAYRDVLGQCDEGHETILGK